MTIEEMVGRELKDGIDMLGKVPPLVPGYIAPVFKAATDL